MKTLADKMTQSPSVEDLERIKYMCWDCFMNPEAGNAVVCNGADSAAGGAPRLQHSVAVSDFVSEEAEKGAEAIMQAAAAEEQNIAIAEAVAKVRCDQGLHEPNPEGIKIEVSAETGNLFNIVSKGGGKCVITLHQCKWPKCRCWLGPCGHTLEPSVLQHLSKTYPNFHGCC